jgi:pantetheine-phosphate adenylyltransferase
LDDPLGSTIYNDDFDAIVVIEETEPTAIKINEIRKERNMLPLNIFVIQLCYSRRRHSNFIYSVFAKEK